MDVVGVYGGNGTVAEVAEGLAGSGVPLWILPGGTGNGTAGEFGLPRTLKAAARVLLDPGTRVGTVDLGRVGDRVFVLRAGIGAIVEVDRLASREMKDRVGGLAYVSAGLEVLRRTAPSKYRLTIDDRVVEQEAVACIVANGAGFGGFGMLAEGVSMTDGVLDVFLFGPEGSRAAPSNLMGDPRLPQPGGFPTARVGSGRRIRVETETPQPAVADGEYAGETPIDIEVLPVRLDVLLPPAAEDARVPRPPRAPSDSGRQA
jgi:diacylglycerol kinase (ATP)